MPKLKNILIFAVIAIILILIAVFVMNSSSSNQAGLVSSSTSSPVTSTGTTATDNTIVGASASTQAFLNTLLNVKNIKLDVDIFSDPAFTSLHDSSILLVPDATTGRINPFAQFGAGDSAVSNPASGTSATLPVTTTPSASITSQNTILAPITTTTNSTIPTTKTPSHP